MGFRIKPNRRSNQNCSEFVCVAVLLVAIGIAYAPHRPPSLVTFINADDMTAVPFASESFRHGLAEELRLVALQCRAARARARGLNDPEQSPAANLELGRLALPAPRFCERRGDVRVAIIPRDAAQPAFAFTAINGRSEARALCNPCAEANVAQLVTMRAH